ncbi:MAG: hypothetical protein JJW00_04610, partial [Sulfurimonas sp.]|nr:hypothetical protein [Sulfurimonas sp.]
FEVVLYQAGYLTIDKMIIDEDLEEITYKLKLPNMEVKKSLNDSIISALTKNNNPNQHKLPVIKALKKANLEDLKRESKDQKPRLKPRFRYS